MMELSVSTAAYAKKHGLPLVTVKKTSIDACTSEANDLIIENGYTPLGQIQHVEAGSKGTPCYVNFYFINLWKPVVQ